MAIGEDIDGYMIHRAARALAVASWNPDWSRVLCTGDVSSMETKCRAKKWLMLFELQ